MNLLIIMIDALILLNKKINKIFELFYLIDHKIVYKLLFIFHYMEIDPIELGQQLLNGAELDDRVKAASASGYEQGKKDSEQAMKNKEMETVTPSAAVPVFKRPAAVLDGRKGLTSLRDRAAESIVKKFGPGWFPG